MDRVKIKETFQDKTLLFVDDDLSICEGINNLLERYFKKIYIATDADSAIDIYKNNKVDIVVSDVTMPDKNGFEMAEEIYEYDSNLKIVFISGHNEKYYIENMKKYGSMYLIKPINYRMLFDLLVDLF
jgi:YesN/AraC family two-component response regulator